MAAYRRVDDLTVTCRLTACTPGSAPGPTLGIEYGKPLPLPLLSLATANNAKIAFCLSVVRKIDILFLKPHVICLNRFGKYKMKENSNIKYSVPQRPQTDALRCDSLRYCDDFTTNVLWTINEVYYNATRAHVHSVIGAA